MEALTDKIINKLKSLASQCNDGSEYQKGLLTAIGQIEFEESVADFEEISRVLMKHLGNPEKYHPHFTVITTNCTSELVEGKKALGHVMDYVPD